MIRHMFMGKAKPETTEEQLAELLTVWANMPNDIPEIRALSAGKNISPRNQVWTVGLVADFDDIDAWQRFADHPAHKAITENYSGVYLQADGRAMVQFEIN